MRSFLVIFFLLGPYLLLSTYGNELAARQQGAEMMACCVENVNMDMFMDCCDMADNHEHNCGDSSCGEIGCNISLQLKNTMHNLSFSFVHAPIDNVKFTLQNRDIVTLDMESVWHPPKKSS